MPSDGNANVSDATSPWARRWRDLTALHIADLGHAEHLSEGQISLCRRISAIEVQLEQMEARMSEGDDSIDLDLFNRLAGNLRRCLETIGLERKARPVENDKSLFLLRAHGLEPRR